jgi:glutaredoxin-related protein
MDKTIVIIIIVIILAGVGFWAWQSGIFSKVPQIAVQPAQNPGGIILFYSPNCPHCQDVEAFIASNNIDQKVKYTKLEIPFAGKTSPQLEANAELAIQLAQKCKLDVSQGVGIPFLYDGNGNCYVGEIDVPAFFKTAAGIK